MEREAERWISAVSVFFGVMLMPVGVAIHLSRFVKNRTDQMAGWLVNLIAVPYGLWIAWVGVQHFRDPSWFEPIVPEVIGNARFWVYASGAFEIVLGIGVALPWFRKEAALGLTLMLIVLYWAN